MKYVTFLLIFFVSIILSASHKLGYYRYPALYQDTLIFTAEGDLWTVNIKGGVAQRLTTHHGLESHAAISQDGRLVAFSAQYEGPTEVYTMPLDGGVPERKTYEGGSAIVIGWTPAGEILYSTRKYSTLPNTQLVSINIKTNAKNVIPLSQASDGHFDPQQRTLFFTRLPFQGSSTKRYMGGTAQNIWKFSLTGKEARPLTADYAGTSKAPLVWKERIYFTTDRDGTMNLWSMTRQGKDLKQHTFHQGFDINYPSRFQGKIVYQGVADLFLYDISTQKEKKLNIFLSSDFDQMRDRWVKKPLDYLTAVHPSPTGDRIVLTARGQVFVAPLKEGRLVRVTRLNGVRYRNALFMPDGKNLLMLSDQSGEPEYWQLPANGLYSGHGLTNNGKVFRYQGLPSPDGRFFVFRDKNYCLWIFSLTTKKTTLIARSENSNFYHLAWSADSKWLAYVNRADNQFSRIFLFNLKTKKILPLTSERVDSYNPVWSPDGNWLYFLSDRQFRSMVPSPWGPRQPEPFLAKTTGIYAIALKSGLRFPFNANDELSQPKKKAVKNRPGKAGDKTEKIEEVIIELKNIDKRIFKVPVPVGAYSSLSVTKTHLFWLDSGLNYQRRRKLQALAIKNQDIKAKTVMENVRNYELTGNSKRLMVRRGERIFLIPANGSKPTKINQYHVNLKSWSFAVNPGQEWRQMFIEAWRLERDYFYDPQLHNVGYRKILTKYLPFVTRITERSELSDLTAHMVGELSALHIFVRGGDIRKGSDVISPASLGAVLNRDVKAGGYTIKHIFRSDPDYPSEKSPLARPGLNIKIGDVIIAINGLHLLKAKNPSIPLSNQAGKQVLLTIKSKQQSATRQVIVTPISPRADTNLRYNQWELERREMVEKLGQGEIGYVHLRAMGGRNYSEWARHFYPVFKRQGLIIDVRHNRGGNIDSWILEKLLRRAWFYWKSRVGKPTWNMQYAFRGHMVVVCNERTASDGEAFAEGFRRLGLGKVIGTRTWGGEIWLSFNNWLVDKGIASAAETGVYGPEGQWLIEGHGVDPDIVVDNLPHATFKGKDTQLEAAVRHLQEKIKKDPRPVPKHPPYPDKRVE